MRKIALLVYDISLTGGAERVAINLANEFVHDWAVYIISASMASDIPENIDKRIRCFVLSKTNTSITKNFFFYRNTLNRIIRTEEIDLILAITAGVVTIAVEGSKNTNTKVIYCEHSNLENRTYGRKHLFRQYYGAVKADLIVTLTERDKNNFRKYFKIKEAKVVAIPNWYNPSSTQHTYDCQSKKIISVGRLERVKGYEYLLDCAEEVLKKNPGWEWDIYGDGSLYNDLKRSILDRHISNLFLRGNVNNLEKKYSDYAFMVMTSRYEGLPLSLLEAQVAHLPIVSFDCPTGPSEIIIDGVNGYIIPQYDVKTMEMAIQSLISSEKKRASFSSHSQDKLVMYEKKHVLEIWKKLIDSLLKDKTE